MVRNGVEWSGVEWSGVEWSGVEVIKYDSARYNIKGGCSRNVRTAVIGEKCPL